MLHVSVWKIFDVLIAHCNYCIISGLQWISSFVGSILFCYRITRSQTAFNCEERNVLLFCYLKPAVSLSCNVLLQPGSCTEQGWKFVQTDAYFIQRFLELLITLSYTSMHDFKWGVIQDMYSKSLQSYMHCLNQANCFAEKSIPELFFRVHTYMQKKHHSKKIK